MHSVVILASTNGTIIPDIINYDYQGKVEFVTLITDKKDCGARQKAEANGLLHTYIEPTGKTRAEWDAACVEILQNLNIDLVIMVGFMRIVSPTFVDAFPGKILNVHPSLLPKFAGGMDGDVHQAVLDAGETESGATVHIVTAELDAGPIITQKAVNISPDETATSLKAKVQKVEGEIYPEGILKVINNNVNYV